MPTPLHSLKITELNEISFVDKGDNPPAGVIIVKSAPPTPGATVAEQDIQKQIDAAVAKAKADAEEAAKVEKAALEARVAKMEEDQAVAKTADFCKSAGLDFAKLGTHIRAIEKAAPEAAVVLKAELERLAKGRAAAVNLNGKQIAGVGKAAGGAQSQMDAKVAEIMKRDNLARPAAYSKMLSESPELYAAYKAELES